MDIYLYVVIFIAVLFGSCLGEIIYLRIVNTDISSRLQVITSHFTGEIIRLEIQINHLKQDAQYQKSEGNDK
jgi:hypothetical protein